MLNVALSNRFKKDLKLAQRRGLDLRLLNDVVDLLAQEKPLPECNKDHALTGKYTAFRECHIKPDGLLIYRVEEEVLALMLFRTVLMPISSISKVTPRGVAFCYSNDLP